MNARLSLGMLAAADVALTAFERFGGAVASWGTALARAELEAAQARARRMLAVNACVRALQRLSAPAQAAALLELLQRLEGLPAELCAAQYLIAALEAAAAPGRPEAAHLFS